MKKDDIRFHVVFITLAYKDVSVSDFFNYAVCQVNQAMGLAEQNVRVTVISRFSTDKKISRNGVEYYFVNDGKSSCLKKWQLSKKTTNLVFSMNPDIIHLHGFFFPRFFNYLLRKNKGKSKVVLEYHSDSIPRKLKWIAARNFRKVDKIIFANYQAARLWAKSFSLSENKWAFSIECAPDSKFMKRESARQISGFSGFPIFLWNSRLITRRDPLTVISGFEAFLKLGTYPYSHFYMMIPDCDEALFMELTQKIAASELLKNAVSIIKERKPLNKIAAYFNSADYVISGSLEDGYGYGVADAMSCGVIPIVTDISTFKQITGNGLVGGLWEAGNAKLLAESITLTVSRTFPTIKDEALRVSNYFDKHLSQKAH
ncbi:glycosyltransferase family 4 protein [uncultured Arcticibacterium sp.]|uniref:glycosyltransferase family 4 protein n=1 Tax=uncultured Arcticibacterium sp. TaxID=2173042 RepID=UPI0030FAECA3